MLAAQPEHELEFSYSKPQGQREQLLAPWIVLTVGAGQSIQYPISENCPAAQGEQPVPLGPCPGPQDVQLQLPGCAYELRGHGEHGCPGIAEYVLIGHSVQLLEKLRLK